MTLADRVFTNRNLRLSSIRAVGFDLDHTLAIYRGGRGGRAGPMDLAVWRETVRKLRRRGYPPLLERLRYDPRFAVRGLVLDTRLGTILKIDRHKYVAAARRGTEPLPDPVRKALYANVRIEMESGRFVSVDSFFEFPESHLWALLVDHLAPRGARPARLYRDVRRAVDLTHRDGTVKGDVIRRPRLYLERDPRLGDLLDRLRHTGVRTFLLTNSEYAYTDALLGHLLGAGWSARFDVIVCEATKPAFYRDLRRLRDLERALGAAGPEILYFGDHTFGDILRSKKIGWRTGMIVPEVAMPPNPYWGDPFVAGTEISRFADQMRDHSCIYTARVTNLLHYPPDHYFEARRTPLPHEFEDHSR